MKLSDIPSTLLSKSKARCKRKFSRISFSWGKRIFFVGAFLLALHLVRSSHLGETLLNRNPVESEDGNLVEPFVASEQNSIPGRRLLSVSGNTTDGNSTGSHHGPVWEQCDFEKAHVPYAWLPLYIFIIFVIFSGIAIICDDFFVPSLEAISEKLDLSEDVAGATFMAAGSSAPELFTSVAGVGTNSDVGVGTIVGSAMFNILTIVALSAVLAGQTLHLDWRPLFRDSVVYSISIALFIGFSWDGKLEWWEALILLLVYVGYIVLMKFNQYLVKGLAKVECFWCRNQSRIEAEEDEVSESGQSSSKSDRPETEDHHHKSAHESHDEHKHRFVHSHRGELAGSFANRRRSTSHALEHHHSQNSNLTHRSEHHKIAGIPLPFIQTVAEYEHEHEDHTKESNNKAELNVEDLERSKSSMVSEGDSEEAVLVLIPYLPPIRCTPPDPQQAREEKTIGWIKFVFKCIMFVICFPFVVAYSWTIPDCSKNRKWYVVTFSFLMSILWIAVTSFALVTIVARTGCILNVDQFTMGLVVVAIGTSVPDCLSSVLVARDGFGDMAVSNAIGSNVFDINLGMGLPFLISICINRGAPFMLVSQEMLNEFEAGEFILIPHAKFGFLLLFVLILAVSTLTLFRFRLNKWTGVCFVFIYFLFLVYAFLQELLPGCEEGRRC